MPTAFIPSPARNLWHLGPIPIRAYAICVVVGIVVGLWVAGRRYRQIGGRRGMILDIATVAIPAGLVGARLYSVVIGYQNYFEHGHDWTNVFRIWDGGLGVPGAVIGGGLGAWIFCRREGAGLAPVAGAVAPGLAFAQAIGRLGNWFNQALYGHPTTLPWAVEISPVHRLASYVNFATFQPTFLYESLWDALVGALVIYAARRFLLPGDRTFAVYLGLYALGRFLTQALAIDYSPRVFGLRVDQVLMILILAGSVAYLYLTRNERGPDSISGTRNAGPSAADHEGVAGSGVASAGDTSNRVGDDALARGAAADPAVG
jgi:prolipoprotein diacylglyceryl transferase